MAKPFLQCHHPFKNGKDHCYTNGTRAPPPPGVKAWPIISFANEDNNPLMLKNGGNGQDVSCILGSNLSQPTKPWTIVRICWR